MSIEWWDGNPRAKGERITLRDVGIIATGTSIGLDPATIAEVREEAGSDAEAARRLGCSAATVARVRKAETLQTMRISKLDAPACGAVWVLMEKNPGIWSTAALTVATGYPEAAVRRALLIGHACGITIRVAGGWQIGAEDKPMQMLPNAGKEYTLGRRCPKDPGHGVHGGKYCGVCKARLAKVRP